MPRRKLLQYWLFAAPFVLMSVAPAMAQESDQTVEMVRRVYRMAHSDAADAAQVLNSILRDCRTGVDVRSNAIVVSGPAEEVEAALTLLAELDVPLAPESDAQSVILRLRTEPPKDFTTLVQTVLGKTRFAFDSGSGLLVLRSPSPPDIEQVERLIQQLEEGNRDRVSLDQEAKGLTAAFYFVAGQHENAARPAAYAHTLEQSPADRAVWEKLEKPITIAFEDEPLHMVVGRLFEPDAIDSNVIWYDLEAIGIDRDNPVTLRLRNPTPLRTVLRMCLDQVGAELELGFNVQDGTIKIATRELLDRDVTQVVYDVRDLINSAPQQDRSGDKNGNMDSSRRVAEDLLDAIMESVAPDSWRRTGSGKANAAYVNGQLIITQNEAAHRAIGFLLAELRERQAQPHSIGPRLPLPPVLEPVGKALAESGIQNVSLLAPLVVRVRHDQHFEVSGTAVGAGATSMKVQGRAERRPGSDLVDLEMVGELSRIPAWPQGDISPRVVFEIQNSITLKLGDLVVLAASPATTDNGQAIALVVRVTEGD